MSCRKGSRWSAQVFSATRRAVSRDILHLPPRVVVTAAERLTSADGAQCRGVERHERTADDHPHDDSGRPQQRYDHRLRDLNVCLKGQTVFLERPHCAGQEIQVPFRTPSRWARSDSASALAFSSDACLMRASAASASSEARLRASAASARSLSAWLFCSIRISSAIKTPLNPCRKCVYSRIIQWLSAPGSELVPAFASVRVGLGGEDRRSRRLRCANGCRFRKF
jgi:hypothetical protein